MSGPSPFLPKHYEHMARSALKAASGRSPLHRFLGEPYLGFRLPDSRECTFVLGMRDYDSMATCCCSHVPSNGTLLRTVFELPMANLRDRPVSFNHQREFEHELKVGAYLRMRAGIEAHNAVVQPIDNGPDDRVYFSETGHRVAEAVRASCEGQPDSIELQSACRANLYAADIVIRNFNRQTEE